VPNNSVGTNKLKNNAVTHPKVKNNTLRFNDLRGGEVVDFKRPLRPGRTLTGLYSLRGINDFEQYHLESFGFRIPAPALGHWLTAGQPSTPECPGNVGAPAAAPGHLCVYESFASNINQRFFYDPRAFSLRTTSFRDGFALVANNTANGAIYVSAGSWALTTASTTPPAPTSNRSLRPSGNASSVTGD